MKYIFSFDSVNDNELLLSGGKAASLVKLKKNGLNVPEGYIITASALENNLLNKKAAAELNELITMLSDRYTYAVRSSALNEDGAAASFAGAYETVTDVKKEDIENAVLEVARSAENIRVKKYADSMNKAKSGMSIVIQRFVRPQLAGVLFTSDIITGSSAKMTGSYVHGEGEQLVSGNSNGIPFFFDALKYAYSGSSELKKYAKALYKSAVRIRRLYGCPMDIEWAVSEGKVYILQARPITTLARFDRDSYRINGSLGGEYLFSRTNVGEIFMSTVSPVTYSIIEIICNTIRMPNFVDNICGQAYFNLSAVCSALVKLGLSRKKAFSLISDIAGKLPEGVEVPIYPYDKVSVKKHKKKITSQKAEINEEFIEHIPDLALETISEIKQCKSSKELAALWEDKCFGRIISILRTLVIFVPYMGALLETKQKLAKAADEELAARLCSGSMGILESMKPLLFVEDVIAGKLSREEYIRQCGHRSVDEMELAKPHPYENPDFPDNIIRMHKSSGADVHKMQADNELCYNEAVAEFKRLYPSKAIWLDRTMAKYKKANRLRENARGKSIWIFCIMREFLLKAAELNNTGDDIFMLYMGEVFELLNGDSSVLKNAAARKESYDRYCTYPAFPNVIYGRFEPEKWLSQENRRCDFYTDKEDITADSDISAQIKGYAGAAGTVTGKVRVISRLEDADTLEKGEILVTTATNIGWTVIFPKAAAIQ